MNTIKKAALFFALVLMSMTAVNAQQNVYVNESQIVTRMMYHLVNQNQMKAVVDGWRIQILATTDRRKMEEVKEEFRRNYPDVLVDWQHDKPYYKLRAGAFPTKLAATRLLYRLKKEFPSAYPAKDNEIPPRQLLGY